MTYPVLVRVVEESRDIGGAHEPGTLRSERCR